jgi:hypothetical protein
MPETAPPPRTLETLSLDPRIAALGGAPPAGPADDSAYFSIVPPTPVGAPHLVAFNLEAAALIDLDPAQAQRPEFIEIMAGNRPLPNGLTIATTAQDSFAGLAGKNQIEFWCNQGLIAGCPSLDVDATTPVAKAVGSSASAPRRRPTTRACRRSRAAWSTPPTTRWCASGSETWSSRTRARTRPP